MTTKGHKVKLSNEFDSEEEMLAYYQNDPEALEQLTSYIEQSVILANSAIDIIKSTVVPILVENINDVLEALNGWEINGVTTK